MFPVPSCKYSWLLIRNSVGTARRNLVAYCDIMFCQIPKYQILTGHRARAHYDLKTANNLYVAFLRKIRGYHITAHPSPGVPNFPLYGRLLSVLSNHMSAKSLLRLIRKTKKKKNVLRRVFCETSTGRTTLYSIKRSPCDDCSNSGMPFPLIVCTNPTPKRIRWEGTITKLETYLAVSLLFEWVVQCVHLGESDSGRSPIVPATIRQTENSVWKNDKPRQYRSSLSNRDYSPSSSIHPYPFYSSLSTRHPQPPNQDFHLPLPQIRPRVPHASLGWSPMCNVQYGQ